MRKNSTNTKLRFNLSFLLLSRIPTITSFSITLFSPVRLRPGLIDRRKSQYEIHQTTPSLSMISNFLGRGGIGDGNDSLPRDVKEAVSKCRGAVQLALENRLSRMDIEFPVGTDFGVEKKNEARSKKKLASALNDGEGPTKETFDSSDRELARLFVEMFQPVGGDAISVIFKDGNLAQLAEKNWRGDSGASCKIMSMDRGKDSKKRGLGMKGKKKKKAIGFAAKMAEEFDDGASGPFQLPQGCEVALFVAPGPKELVAIERICNDVGMGTLVILLNARLDRMSNNFDFFYDEFESVYYLSTAPHGASLMYRSYPNEWILARRSKVGSPKTFARFSDCPTPEECREAYESIEMSKMEEGFETTLENVANWFN